MKNLLKILLLLSIFTFINSCQIKKITSDFTIVDEDLNLTPNFSKPDDSDSDEGINGNLSPLTEEELYIENIEDFNLSITSEPTVYSKGIIFAVFGERIDNDIVTDTKLTQVEVQLQLIEHEGVNINYIRNGVELIKNDFNIYSILYTKSLQQALPTLDSYAKYKVDVYIKDLRKDENKKYLVTHREFEFTVNRIE